MFSKFTPRFATSNYHILYKSVTQFARGYQSVANMRLVQFSKEGSQYIGAEIEKDGDIIDLNVCDKSLPNNMIDLFKDQERFLPIIEKALEHKSHVMKRETVKFKSPLTGVEKIICIGMNYFDHCKEQNVEIPKAPLVFSKFPSTISDPYGPVVKPPHTEQLDWEVELAIVIGKGGSYIKEENVMEHIAGYTVAHDVSARDWQMNKNGGQWLLGKTFDTFCPLGPCLVTPNSLSDPHNLGIRCRVNGEIMQDSNTNNLVFNTNKLIPYLSSFFTLSVGDVILTGTPGGVGVFRKPPIFLKKGDVVECEIDEIGCIRNTIKDASN